MISRSKAKELARSASPEQVIQMLVEARKNIKNWQKPSSNKSLSLGVMFNIMWKCGKNGKNGFTSELARINAIHNFGEYFPGYKSPQKESRQIAVTHQEPMDIQQEDE